VLRQSSGEVKGGGLSFHSEDGDNLMCRAEGQIKKKEKHRMQNYKIIL